MQRYRLAISLTFVLLVISLLPAGSVASGSSGYDLSWWAMVGGGETLDSDAHRLGGTSGQASADVLTSSSYTLQSGFRRCAVAHDIYDIGVVDIADVQYAAARWRSADLGLADRTGDGSVSVEDIILVASHLGERC